MQKFVSLTVFAQVVLKLYHRNPHYTSQLRMNKNREEEEQSKWVNKKNGLPTLNNFLQALVSTEHTELSYIFCI